MRRRQPGKHHRPDHVAVEDRQQRRFVERLNRAAQHVAGVVEQPVELASAKRHRCRDHARAVSCHRNVARDPAAAGLLRHRADLVGAPSADRHLRSAQRQMARGGLAQPRSAAGDQHAQTFDRHHRIISFSRASRARRGRTRRWSRRSRQRSSPGRRRAPARRATEGLSRSVPGGRLGAILISAGANPPTCHNCGKNVAPSA